MTLRELLHQRRDDILRIAERYRATRVRLFGSAARGEEDAASDVDLLVEMPENHSLLDRAALKAELEAVLQRQVDVATERSLKPRIREQVLCQAVEL